MLKIFILGAVATVAASAAAPLKWRALAAADKGLYTCKPPAPQPPSVPNLAAGFTEGFVERLGGEGRGTGRCMP